MSDIFFILSRLNFSSIVDILLVTLIFFWILTLIQGTQAVQLLRGILILAVLVTIAASAFNTLTAFSWLVGKILPALLVAIPVIFQPELRKALERVGRRGSKFFITSQNNTRIQEAIKAVCRAVEAMAQIQHGALIVFERNTGLADYIETGVPLESEVTADLIRTIFFPNTALHDGAVIIHEGRIAAASVVLPLGENVTPGKELLGTRHRASLGITEATDAIAVVVSEETGIISVSSNGDLIRNLTSDQLESFLLEAYKSRPLEPVSFWRRTGQFLLKRLGLKSSPGSTTV